MKLKKIKPLWTTVITTAYKYSFEELQEGDEIIDVTKMENPLKEYQKVLLVGDQVRNVKPGDIVMINPIRYQVRQYSRDSIKNDIEGMNPVTNYSFPMIELAGEDCLKLEEGDISYIIEEFEEDKKKKTK